MRVDGKEVREMEDAEAVYWRRQRGRAHTLQVTPSLRTRGPSLRSGFQQRAPASLTPARRLNFAAHASSFAALRISAAGSGFGRDALATAGGTPALRRGTCLAGHVRVGWHTFPR